MKCDNIKSSKTLVWLYVTAMIIEIAIIAGFKLFHMDTLLPYLIVSILLFVSLIRFLRMKCFKMETTEDFITLNTRHPLMRGKRFVFELPWEKIGHIQLRRSIFSHYLYIEIFGRRKDKLYYYKLGRLSESDIRNIKTLEKNINLGQDSLYAIIPLK